MPRGFVRVALMLIALCAVTWAGHGLVRAAISLGYEAPRGSAPTVVKCVLEPLHIAPLPCTSAILVEAETGSVLYAQNADEARGPASLVKMMLQLLVYEDLAAERIELDTKITASANAATMGGSQVFLEEGESRTLADLMDAVAIASANDASMAIAEHLAGDEPSFVARMNRRARELGCRGTHFANVHGLDLRNQPKNVTTARDLAIIGRELVKHPRALEVSSTRRKQFRGEDFYLDNTNKLLGRFDGLDGLKTGWTPRAGGCFVATAEREGVRMIAVVLAAVPGRARFRVTGKLLEAAYAGEPAWIEAVHARDEIRGETDGRSAAAHVQAAGSGGSQEDPVEAIAGGTVRLLVERARAERISTRLREQTPKERGEAPADSDGWLDLRLDGRTVATIPAQLKGRG